MITRKIALVICCLSFMLIGFAQSPPFIPNARCEAKDEKKTLPQELQAQVNAAISKGTQYLYQYVTMEELPELSVKEKSGLEHSMRYADLILYTLAHCGVATNEDWDKFLQKVTKFRLDKVYHVSLQAMALEHIDREKYQARIADCAQYLVENQCKNGQWSYGSERSSPRWVKTSPGKDKVVITDGGKKPGEQSVQAPKTASGSTQSKKINTINVTGAPQGPPTGDNSNTQYAILGLRACIESNVTIPDATLQSAKKWLLNCQNKDGSWGYSIGGSGYGSMTLGAIGSLAILKYHLKETKDLSKEAWFTNGLKWITGKYTVSKNPEGDQGWLYYYLYAMERLGVLAEQEKIGNNNWYLDGAKFLVEKQAETGNWNNNISDTCFALLFLTKATKPLKIVKTGE